MKHEKGHKLKLMKNLLWTWVYCEECRKVQRREHGLLANYGITTKQYNELLRKQDYSCAICGTKDPRHKGHFHVDHNHLTGEIRGLLCHGCNTALGLFCDSTIILSKAIIYLNNKGSYG